MKTISASGIVLAFSLLAAQALAGPVSHFGALERCGKNICGKITGQSTPIFFKGPSLYWSDGSGVPFYNLETVDWFVDNLQIGIIRAAMAIKYYDGNNSEPVNKPGGVAGYLQNNKAAQKAYIKKVIDAAIANDIYVIVDWHSHVAHNETSEAVTFFTEIAKEYPDCPNIVWEVFNEPMSIGVDQVTNHSNTVINAIRAAGNNNLAIIGSPSWSTNPNNQSSNWGGSRDKNVAFSFHFYAGTHTFPSGGGGSSAQDAMKAGYAVFGTEWGSVNADGKGSPNTGSSDTWTNWMDSEKISNCMWNASDLNEGSSMFTNGTTVNTLSTSRLTESGKYFQTYMGKNKWTAQIPSNHPKGNDVTFSVNDGETATFTATQLGLSGTITEVKSRETFPVEVSKTDNSITYKADGSQKGKVVLIYKVTQGSITTQSKVTINITNRLPVVPIKNAIQVSRKAQTTLSITNDLGVTDPEGTGIQVVSVSVSPTSAGTVTTSGSSIVFTPAAGADGTDATLSYTVKNSKGNRTGTITLQIRNIAPTIRPITNTFSPSVPNTDPVVVDIERFSGKDADGDAIWFDKLYLDPQYPGRLEKVSDASYLYHPEAGKIGKVAFLAVVTDGDALSLTGRANITLTGSGTEINVTPPTSIPGVIDPIDPGDDSTTVIRQYVNAKGMGLYALGSGKVQLYLATSGIAKLDIYSLSGKKIGNLLSGHQTAGSKEVSLNSLNLQKGVYILRLSQGSQVKTLRIVN